MPSCWNGSVAEKRWDEPQREKGRLYQVKQRGWREERELARRLENGLLRGLRLPRRVEWFVDGKAEERASETA